MNSVGADEETACSELDVVYNVNSCLYFYILLIKRTYTLSHILSWLLIINIVYFVS